MISGTGLAASTDGSYGALGGERATSPLGAGKNPSSFQPPSGLMMGKPSKLQGASSNCGRGTVWKREQRVQRLWHTGGKESKPSLAEDEKAGERVAGEGGRESSLAGCQALL